VPNNEEIIDATKVIQNEVDKQIITYNMTDVEIDELATTEIIEQTEEQEDELEQEVESEAFELQGEIAYEGDRATTWNVTLGDYKGLTYYSQIDSRWKNIIYSSVNNSTQTIGSSGCGPTSAAMIVTATKGAITPETMASLFVKYGYRSANNGTYWSAFRAIADEFNIAYQETTNVDTAINLLRNNNYVVASVGNGLFTTGGHFIVLVGVEGDTIKVYDPYLYSGKFDTATRRGKATVNGNTVYVSVSNFKKYANAQGFFCYKHDSDVPINDNKPVTTSSYTRYVKVNTTLNVRNTPNGKIVGSLRNGAQVTVYSTSGNWSYIGDNRWVCTDYLTSTNPIVYKTTAKYSLGLYRVNANALNVRYGAGTNYKIKRTYIRGTRFDTYEIKNNWARTPSGWVCLDYCTLIKKY